MKVADSSNKITGIAAGIHDILEKFITSVSLV